MRKIKTWLVIGMILVVVTYVAGFVYIQKGFDNEIKGLENQLMVDNTRNENLRKQITELGTQISSLRDKLGLGQNSENNSAQQPEQIQINLPKQEPPKVTRAS